MLLVAIPHSTDVAFGQFWQAYPKKVGKFEARRAWTKAIKAGTLDEMLTALAWQTQSRQWKAGYIPNPSTYLNQGRWLDEPEADLSVSAPLDLAPCPRCGALEGLCRDIKACNARWLAQEKSKHPARAASV